MKSYIFLLVFILTIGTSFKSVNAQSQITISLPVSTTCSGSTIKVRISSYSGFTWPIDNLQKREQTNGVWGSWTNTGAGIGYDGISYFWNATITKPTQFRGAESVSGGTLYSNTVTANLYLPRLLLYGQDGGSASTNYVADQNQTIDFDINTLGNNDVIVTWYKNNSQVSQSPYNTTTCPTCSYRFNFSNSNNQTYKAYVYNNTLGCGAYTNEITITPDYYIALVSNKKLYNNTENAEIQITSSNISGATPTLYRSTLINGVWSNYSLVTSSLVWSATFSYQYWSIPITGRTRFYAEAYPGFRVTSETLEVGTINSVTIYQPRVSTFTETNVLSASIGDVNKSINYFDGLGRPIQSVSWKNSPLQKDMVQPVVYDGFGREYRKYLPVVTNTTDGWYKEGIIDVNGNFAGAALNFYNNTSDNIADDTKPFAETVFEDSPLNRVLKQGAAGAAWQPDATNSIASTDRTLKFGYETNAINEVLLWKFTYPTSSYPFGIVNTTDVASPTIAKYYEANQLSKSISKDEHQNLEIEYKDKLGRIILKRVQLSTATSPINDSNYASTYYIYDDFGQLVCVVPPEATARLATEYYHASTSNTIKDNFMKRWAFRYAYDDSKRMIQKQLPGAEPVYMVYDNRDRLLMTQDGKQRSPKEWSYIKYDTLNRPIITGVYTHGSIIDQFTMSGLISKSKFTEAYNGASSTHGYTNTVWPTAGTQVLTVTYYDNYLFKSMRTGLNYVAGQLTGQRSAEFATVKGQVTGQKINKLAASTTYFWTATYYDDKYRPIQTIAENHKSGKETLTSVYDFIGQIMKNRRLHTYPGQPDIIIEEEFTYDHAGRVLNHYHKIDSAPKIILANYKYNELGQVVEKNLHSENSQSKTIGIDYLQHIDYRYNIRGWLSHINNAALDVQSANNDDSDDLFGMELFYNTRPTGISEAAQFNGNISAVKWGVNENGTKTAQGYGYAYDKLNRLTDGIHYTGTASLTATGKYKEYGITYDKNGNITKLLRTMGTSSLVDSLIYNYGSSTNRSNKLLKVSDKVGANFTSLFKDGINLDNDYAYADGNGNMTKDQNKGISSIVYNLLNLPQIVTLATGSINYSYDATGKKLAKQVTGASTSTTDYLEGIQYSDGVAEIAQTMEGRLRKNGSVWSYEYDLNDHLGNVRVSFDKHPTLGVARLIQKDDYYPFGLAYTHPNVVGENRYLYNDFEFQQDLGLDLYDYQARFYDPELGRFINIDPASDLMRRISPYSYAYNNPIRFTDPDGMMPEDTENECDEACKKKKEEEKKKKQEEKYKQLQALLKEKLKDGAAVKLISAQQDATSSNSDTNRELIFKELKKINKNESTLGIVLGLASKTTEFVELGSELSGKYIVPKTFNYAIDALTVADKISNDDYLGAGATLGKAAAGLYFKWEIFTAEQLYNIGSSDYIQGGIIQGQYKEMQRLLYLANNAKQAGDMASYNYYYTKAGMIERQGLNTANRMNNNRNQ